MEFLQLFFRYISLYFNKGNYDWMLVFKHHNTEIYIFEITLYMIVHSPGKFLFQIPETDNLLKKSRLPLGVLIHPFRDLSQLPIIQCATIVRCRQCRTYINPFVHFVDQRRLVYYSA